MHIGSVYRRVPAGAVAGLLLAGAAAAGGPGPVVSRNGVAQPHATVYFCRTTDTIEVRREPRDGRRLFLVTPVKRDYDNCAAVSLGARSAQAIAYRVEENTSSRTVLRSGVAIPFLPGTYVVGCLPPDSVDTIYAGAPLHREHPGRFLQIVIRDSDTYLGYLSEMFNTPFILCPRTVRHGHQTEHRVGSDCVALAVYGRRRMGKPIPFGTPSDITRYLTPLRQTVFGRSRSESVYRDEQRETIGTDCADGALCPGDIVHYHVQVSVFLRDRGEPGVLDTADLLIHSREGTGPVVEPMGASPYAAHAFRVYRWRE